MNCRFNSIEGFEGTAQSLGGVDDTNAINTLAQIAKNLMAGGVTVPGNMIVKGGSIATGDAPGQTPGTIISNMGDSWGMLWGSNCALIGQKGKTMRFGFADAFNAAGWDEKVTIQPDGTLIAKSNMNVGGTTTSPVLNLGGKFRLSGAGDFAANDDWLRMTGIDNKNYYGGFAAGKLWTADGTINGRNIFAEIDALKASVTKPIVITSRWDDGAFMAAMARHFNRNEPDGIKKDFLIKNESGDNWRWQTGIKMYGNQVWAYPQWLRNNGDCNGCAGNPGHGNDGYRINI